MLLGLTWLDGAWIGSRPSPFHLRESAHGVSARRAGVLVAFARQLQVWAPWARHTAASILGARAASSLRRRAVCPNVERQAPSKFLKAVAAGGSLDAATTRELSNLMAELARAPGMESLLLRCAAAFAASLDRSHQATPQDLAHAAWALAKSRQQGAPALVTVARVATARCADFTLRDLAELLWSFATLLCYNDTLFASAALRATAWLSDVKLGRSKAASQDLANLAWSFAKVCVHDLDFFRAMAAESTRRVGKFKVQELANVAWAFASASIFDGALCAAVAREMSSKLGSFKTQELSSAAWALAKLTSIGGPRGPLGDDDSIGQLADAVASISVGRLGDFSPQSLSNIAWALATFQVRSQSVVSIFDGGVFGKAVVATVTDFSPQALSNIAWAFAAVASRDNGVLDAIAGAVVAQPSPFKLQELSGLVWACATMDIKAPLLWSTLAANAARLLSSVDPRQLTRERLASLALDALVIVWALRFVGHLDVDILAAVRVALRRFGRYLDGRRDWRSGSSWVGQATSALVPAWVSDLCSGGGRVACERLVPVLCLHLPDRLVFHKPPDWEGHRSLDEEGIATTRTNAHQLKDFLAATLPARACPIVLDARHGYGCAHRLDVPCSGLIVAAKTYEAYYDLKLQVSSNEIIREYTGACHGWVMPGRRDIRTRVHWVAGDSSVSSSVASSGPGRPSQTAVSLFAHVSVAGVAERISLLTFRISTGRCHQVRMQMSHIGYPLAGDARYAAANTSMSDRSWCPRVFLHRHRVNFRDHMGMRRDVREPLPPDLLGTLNHFITRVGATSNCVKLSSWAAGLHDGVGDDEVGPV